MHLMHLLGPTRVREERGLFHERYNSDKCQKYIVETVWAGDTVLVVLNYLPELPSRSVDESGLTLVGVILS